MRSLGGDLLVVDSGPEKAFQFVFDAIRRNGFSLPSHIAFNRDYEPFARKRDQIMRIFFDKTPEVAVLTGKDHLLIEPQELIKFSGKEAGYKVYTPFSKVWRNILLSESGVYEKVHRQKKMLNDYLSDDKHFNAQHFNLIWSELLFDESVRVDCLKDQLCFYLEDNKKKVKINIPAAGFAQAINSLQVFQKKINSYEKSRDIPIEKGTSQLSLFLKNGSITTGQIIAFLDLFEAQLNSSEEKYLNELIWREFYYHVLFLYPDVESNAFQKKYTDISWENNEAYFEKWKRGETGYPIVDAGMRELNQTGLMHNRVRMIVASFLTKDLLIDWRWGERYFMQKLLDGDLAANNGGWQWCASTGIDAQPYFRIFNPILQGKKFDPEGDYVRFFIPQLRHLSGKKIHDLTATSQVAGYFKPVVEHDQQRKKALALFKLYNQ